MRGFRNCKVSGMELLLHQGGEFFGVMALPGIADKHSLNLIVPVFQLPGFRFVISGQAGKALVGDKDEYVVLI